MVLGAPAPIEEHPLRLEELAPPREGPGEILVAVEHCGVCRTDLHVVEGDLPPRRPAVVPGHEIVGRVVRVGSEVRTYAEGQRVGIPWLRFTCGACEYCRSARENLCDRKEYTGYTANGGYSELVTVRAEYAFPMPEGPGAPLAPLLCAGIIGFRALKFALPPSEGRVGFFGFGGSAHLALQLAAHLGYETVAYSRNPSHLALAHRLGATDTVATSGPRAETPARSLDGAVVFAPAGPVVLDALTAVKKGATVSIASIHLSPIPAIDYDRLLFGERRLVSVESNTREDAREFLDLAQRYRLESVVTVRPLVQANEALAELKRGAVDGAVVLDCGNGRSA